MKNIKQYVCEGESSIEKEMKEWEERYRAPFGKTIKELQWLINDLGLYAAEKTEYGFYTFTPFDNYVTAYALDGNKKYTYEHIKSICDDWDFTSEPKVKKILQKLEKLSKE